MTADRFITRSGFFLISDRDNLLCASTWQGGTGIAGGHGESHVQPEDQEPGD